MTEVEWLVSDTPKSMLSLLRDRGLASERKMRLFSCAGCRRVWPLLGDQARSTVEVAERYADGAATDEEREAAQQAASSVRQLGAIAAKWAAAFVARTGAMMVVDAAGQTAACPPGQAYDPVRWEGEWREQCAILRDIFGNPFVPTSGIDPSSITDSVLSLAKRAYEERPNPCGALVPAHLAALAVALEAAGCNDAELLAHLRSPGPHVRGCFALDAVLGKS
jgi:hypothetical protein